MAEKETFIIEIVDRFTGELKGAKRELKGVRNEVQKTNDGLRSLKNTIVAAFSLNVIKNFTREIITTTARFEGMTKAISAAVGSQDEGTKSMEFLKRTSSELGIDLQAATEGFKTFAGGAIGTGLQAEDLRKIFGQVSKATAVMGLDADQAKGAFLALGQILSKGKVQAEELRGQLGERIPGAFALMAQGLGVTTQELNKMLELGMIPAEQGVRALANAIEARFGSSVPAATDTLQANMNRLNNSFFILQNTIGQKIAPLVKELAKQLIVLADWISNNTKLIIKIASWVFKLVQAYIAYRAAVVATTVVMAVFRAAQIAAQIALTAYIYGLNAARASLRALNLTMAASPFGLAIAAIGLMAGAFVDLEAKINNVTSAQERMLSSSTKAFSISDTLASSDNELAQVQTKVINEQLGKFKEQLKNLTKDTLKLPSDFERSMAGASELEKNTAKANLLSLQQGRLKQSIEKLTKEIKRREEIEKQFKPEGGLGGGTGGGTSIRAGLAGVRASAPKTFNINIDSLIKEVNFDKEEETQAELENFKENVIRVMVEAINETQNNIN